MAQRDTKDGRRRGGNEGFDKTLERAGVNGAGRRYQCQRTRAACAGGQPSLPANLWTDVWLLKKRVSALAVLCTWGLGRDKFRSGLGKESLMTLNIL